MYRVFWTNGVEWRNVLAGIFRSSLAPYTDVPSTFLVKCGLISPFKLSNDLHSMFVTDILNRFKRIRKLLGSGSNSLAYALIEVYDISQIRSPLPFLLLGFQMSKRTLHSWNRAVTTNWHNILCNKMHTSAYPSTNNSNTSLTKFLILDCPGSPLLLLPTHPLKYMHPFICLESHYITLLPPIHRPISFFSVSFSLYLHSSFPSLLFLNIVIHAPVGTGKTRHSVQNVSKAFYSSLYLVYMKVLRLYHLHWKLHSFLENKLHILPSKFRLPVAIPTHVTFLSKVSSLLTVKVFSWYFGRKSWCVRATASMPWTARCRISLGIAGCLG